MVVLLKLDKSSHNGSDNLSQLVFTQLEFLLYVRAVLVVHQSLHQLVVTDVLLQELVEYIQVFQLEEDPALLQLEHHSAEHGCHHLQQLSILRQRVIW